MKKEDIDVQELINKNFMFLTMLGYGTSIIIQLESIVENYNGIFPEQLLDQIGWFKTAIENIVYKDIPAPKMP